MGVHSKLQHPEPCQFLSFSFTSYILQPPTSASPERGTVKMARSQVPKVNESGITVLFQAENPTIESVPHSQVLPTPLPPTSPPSSPLPTTIHGFGISLIVAATVSFLSTASPVIPKELGHSTTPLNETFRSGSALRLAPATSNLRLPKSHASSRQIRNSPQDWIDMSPNLSPSHAAASIGHATWSRLHFLILESSHTTTIRISAVGSVAVL